MPVSAKKLEDLSARMQQLGIGKGDLREHFVRSSGSGGQHVNKVSTCVVLKHLPSGIEVKCQAERSQALNRFLARRLLCEKLEERGAGERREARSRRWKIRKQKKRRSRRAREKVLEGKRRRSEKKTLRRPVAWE